MQTFLTNMLVLQDRNATVAQVGLTFRDPSDDGLLATGSSKREPGEVYDPEVGRDLAIARALKNLSYQVEKQAMDRYNKLNPSTGPAVGEGEIVAMGVVTGVENGIATVQVTSGSLTGAVKTVPPKKAARPRRLARKPK